MLAYCLIGPLGNVIQNTKIFIKKNVFENVVRKTTAIFAALLSVLNAEI